MKLRGTIYGFYTSARILLRFCVQHHAAIAMIAGIYSTELSAAVNRAAGIDTLLAVRPAGTLYKVVVTDYINNQPVREDTWLAAYSWQSAGRLVEIGGSRICTIDASSGCLYLEDMQSEKRLIVFIKVIKAI